MYEVKKIVGKGLGCIALQDINRDTLILCERPQIPDIHSSAQPIMTLLESYAEMNKSDQKEYMLLHNKYDDMHVLPLHVRNTMKSEILSMEARIRLTFGHEAKKVERILKIYNIYESNCFDDGLSIKTSRFNHSCQPNAAFVVMEFDQDEIRAISDIKKGEEITISYLDGYDFYMRNRRIRQSILFQNWFFVCSCDVCENEDDNNNDVLQELIKEVSDLNNKICVCSNGPKRYTLQICRREIKCYKQIYRLGRHQKVNSLSLFRVVEKAFYTAVFGYQVFKTEDLKTDGEYFAKTAENFGKILGREFVTQGIPDFWRQKYEHFDLCLLPHR